MAMALGLTVSKIGRGHVGSQWNRL